LSSIAGRLTDGYYDDWEESSNYLETDSYCNVNEKLYNFPLYGYTIIRVIEIREICFVIILTTAIH
jgi:hypothetical protein